MNGFIFHRLDYASWKVYCIILANWWTHVEICSAWNLFYANIARNRALKQTLGRVRRCPRRRSRWCRRVTRKRGISKQKSSSAPQTALHRRFTTRDNHWLGRSKCRSRGHQSWLIARWIWLYEHRSVLDISWLNFPFASSTILFRHFVPMQCIFFCGWYQP